MQQTSKDCLHINSILNPTSLCHIKENHKQLNTLSNQKPIAIPKNTLNQYPVCVSIPNDSRMVTWVIHLPSKCQCHMDYSQSNQVQTWKTNKLFALYLVHKLSCESTMLSREILAHQQIRQMTQTNSLYTSKKQYIQALGVNCNRKLTVVHVCQARRIEIGFSHIRAGQALHKLSFNLSSKRVSLSRQC